MGDARALRAPAAGKIELAPLAAVEPAHGQVRVDVRRCGICGSDLHFFLGRGALPAVCPGHEISGEIGAVGDGVAGWAPGDRVAVEPLVRCGSCDRCRRGDYHLCAKIGIAGATFPGGMATSVVVPSYTLFRLPAEVDFELGALAEPLAVTVHALRLGGVTEGSPVLVLGAGSIGLLAAVAARALGAGFVAITARYPHQRDAALRLGCDQVVEPGAHARLDQRPSIAIETVGGAADTVAEGVRSVAPGGTVVVVGMFDRPPGFDPLLLLAKEVRLVGSMVYNRGGREADFDTALRLLAGRGPELRPLVTDVFALGEAQRAFETAADKSAGAVKVQLDPTR